MAFSPTEAQKRAIEIRDKSILLSAAAGSGKTATLTRRIIESLTDKENPLDLSRMLIVTFTRAAASELRERISSALSKALAEDPGNTHLTRQTVILGSADISTIDSFCLNIVKSNFQRLTLGKGEPLPPDFRLADSTELKTLSLSVMNSVIDKWYAKTDDGLDFPKFAENFGNTRGEGTMVETLIKYAGALESVPHPDDFTKENAELFEFDAKVEFFDTRFGKIIKSHTKESLLYCEEVLETAINELSDNGGKIDKNYIPAFRGDLDTAKAALHALDISYEATRDVLRGYKAIGLVNIGKSKSELTDSYKEMRRLIKARIQNLAEKYYSLPKESVAELSKRTASDLHTLAAIIQDYRDSYTKEKLMRRVAEFSDIKALAHTLLVAPNGEPTDIALALRDRYDAVYIDEYQDVDKVQDEIFAAVSRTGVAFTVGDIKQSIYGFRGAEPSIFGCMRQKMPSFGSPESEEKRALSLFMSENFRCDKPVIKFVNAVSANTLVPIGGIVGYRPEDDLVFGKSENTGNTPVKVAFFSKDSSTSDEEEEECSREVVYIVNEIKRLLASEKKNNGEPIVKSDIAVLSRSRSFIKDISDMLKTEGIDVLDESTKDFFGNPEILLVLSLVTAIDNPQKDIPLASVMRSPFFAFSMDELIAIRKSADSSCSLFDATLGYAESDITDSLTKKCESFVSRLNELRAESVSLPVDRFIRKLYKEFRIMSLTDEEKKRTPAAVAANLRRFYEYARMFASTQGGGVSGFISYINGIIETDGEVEAPNVASPDGAVTLLTIHKSKGLEYPVVFVAGCGKYFNRDDLKKSLIFDPSDGVALMPIDETGFAKIDTPQRAALSLAVKEKQTEEEMRILYVALTRARERLYVTATPRSDPQKLYELASFASRFKCRTQVLAVNSFADWILPAVADSSIFWDFEIDPDVSESTLNVSTTESTALTADNTALREAIRERLAYVYPYAHAETLPAKLSVSKLYPEILDDDGASNLESGKLPELREKPLFLSEEPQSSAAERGTATHVFMQFCDFDSAEKNVRDELSRLVTERFIPEGTSELVNVRQLQSFFDSRFYKTVKSAKKLYRELRFNMLLPASEFTASPELATALDEENLLIQGVIDLLMIDANDNIVLCDYKTDYLTRDELADESLAKKKLLDRHGQQLKYYSAAVRQLLGREPDRICIYSLPLGRAIDID